MGKRTPSHGLVPFSGVLKEHFNKLSPPSRHFVVTKKKVTKKEILFSEKYFYVNIFFSKK
tara:strand:+ start:174 stop:353 length:180 start_codon:yes stop_codon:yes gene_type:complete